MDFFDFIYEHRLFVTFIISWLLSTAITAIIIAYITGWSDSKASIFTSAISILLLIVMTFILLR